MDERERERERRRLRTLADYQFGCGAGRALFGGDDGNDGDDSNDGDDGGDVEGDITVRRTSTGRPQQVLAGGDRLVSYGTDGRFTLGVAGGRRLHDALDPPAYRVVVGDESEPFVRDGANAFAKFVVGVDPAIRPGDEVLVVHERGDLIAVGRAELPGGAMRDFWTGMAVKTREGVGVPDGSG